MPLYSTVVSEDQCEGTVIIATAWGLDKTGRDNMELLRGTITRKRHQARDTPHAFSSLHIAISGALQPT